MKQKNNKKIGQQDLEGYGVKLRIWHRKRQKRQSARYLIKCGCCDEKVEIYYDDEEDMGEKFQTLEIGGVNASIGEWKRILLPLLNVKEDKCKQ